MPENISSELKRLVAERAHGCCEYCYSQTKFAMQSFSIEHIVPRSKGGEGSAKNLALACQGCNNRKYTKTSGQDPITGKEVPLFHPRNQQWQEHFAWNDDFTLIIGLTPTGRATVEGLALNRDGLVNLRRILYQAGEHPPIILDET
ncbi:MAG: CRISPR-associated endonuclease Cas9 [Chloroflexi bacterium]|nr:CRISPR-associated endonuclease Cas9 [Chloroflexota bacterium]